MHEDRFFKNLGKDIPLLVVNGSKGFADPNFFYFSAIRFGVFEACSMIVRKGGTTVISNGLDSDAAREAGCEVKVFASRGDMLRIIEEELTGSSEVALNESKIAAGTYLLIRERMKDKHFVDATDAINSTRQIKTKHEQRNLEKACKISIIAHENMLHTLKEGMTEAELQSHLIHKLMLNGSGFPYAEPTVAFGENSAFPHYSASTRRLKKGDLVLTDFGATYNRYVADVTRTVVFGRASNRQKDMYEAVTRARKAGIKAVRGGVEGGKVDLAGRRIIDSTRFKGKFIHGMGHGIGLEIHDHPGFGPSSKFKVQPGMVMTIEPGIYIKHFGGIRVEDDVIVGRDSAKVITGGRKDELLEIS